MDLLGKTDEELMIEYALGDSRAFLELFARYKTRVYAFLKSRIREAQKVDDVFQATFFNLHRFRSRYDASLPFAPWIFSICRNAWIDSLRTQDKALLIGELPEPATAVPIEAPDFASYPGWRELSPAQKSAVELRFKDELPFDEIADRLGTSSTNVRQLLSRAFKKLRGKS